MHPDAPRVVLVHGGSAHGGWWAGGAALLVSMYDVVILDLSGHGDSGHRPDYHPDTWATEVAGVVQDSGDGPAFVVGHSMGGLVGIFMAASFPDLVAGLVIVDSLLRHPGTDATSPRGAGRGPNRVYQTKDEALSRFRLIPGDTAADLATVRFVAERGLRREGGGWTWKSDPRTRRRFTDQDIHDRLGKLACPTGYVFGEKSPIGGAPTVEYLERRLNRPVPSRGVAGAFHHVPLDRPIECAEAIDVVLRALDGSK